MKKLLLYISIPVLFIACKSSPAPGTSSATGADTTGLAAFRQWKTEQEQKVIAAYYAQQIKALWLPQQ